MALTEKILKELKKLSKTQKICKHGKYSTATAIFDASSFDEVSSLINNVIDPIAENGEKIICNIDSGEIIDSQVKGFDIKKGVLIELYDYSSTDVTFIRLYHIRDEKKDWLALYVDENPETPWWTKEEREG
ncbi:MAG: hypothetical protein ACE5J5_00875 [Candidatus Hydrothermarchaeales archaeon]